MKAESIPGVVLSPLEVHADDRGEFRELFRAGSYPVEFVQANHSRSRPGVLRGLHYHRRQSDLWYLASGRAEVGLVDLRTPGETPDAKLLVLDAGEPSTLFIPPGVAHGFLALTAIDLIYLVTELFDASDEYGIAWNDPQVGLRWSTDEPILSDRDSSNRPLEWAEIPSFS